MILCPMCAEFHDAKGFVLKDASGTVLKQRKPTAWDERLPFLPGGVKHWLHNRRVSESRQRLEAGARWQCPRGHALPDDFNETRTLVVGLIGPPQTTKTTYLGRLVSEVVDNAALAPLGIHATLADADSQTYYNLVMARFLEGGRAPAATEKLVNDQTTRPLVVRLVSNTERVNVLFFDASGESQQNTQHLAKDNPFLHALDAAIIFVTPRALALPGQCQLTGNEAVGPRQVIQVMSNLERVLADHPRYRGKHPSRDLPIALTLSKADELAPLVQGRGFSSLELEPTLFTQMVEKLDAQGDLPYEILSTYGGKGILHAAFGLSDVRSIHAVSAMGCSPDQEGRFARMAPLNVAEPLLAILYAHGIVGDRVRN